MAITRIITPSISDDAVDNTKLDLASNYAFTGTISTPLASQNLYLLGSGDYTSNVSSVTHETDFTSFRKFYMEVGGMTDTYGKSICFQVKIGGSFKTGGSDYVYTIRGQDTGGDSSGIFRRTSGDRMPITTNVQTTGELNQASTMSRVWIQANHSSGTPMVAIHGYGGTGGALNRAIYGGGHITAGQLQGIRLVPESGASNLAILYYSIYGVK